MKQIITKRSFLNQIWETPLMSEPITVPRANNAYEMNRDSQKLQMELFGGCVPDPFGDVFEFHRTFNHPILEYCHLPPQERRVFRRSVLHEELEEFDEAYEKNDIAGMADAVVDWMYYGIGWALEHGVPLAKIWKVVQDANMAKLWTAEEVQAKMSPEHREETKGWKASQVLHLLKKGEARRFVVYNAMGKVQKPPTWESPDAKIKAIIDEAMRVPEQEANRRAAQQAFSSEAQKQLNQSVSPGHSSNYDAGAEGDCR